MSSSQQAHPAHLAVAAALSESRMGPFLTASGGNVRDALRLYRWNIEVSGAVYEALHVVEVVLRNSMDGQLSIWNASQRERLTGRQHSGDWLLDPSHLLIRLVMQRHIDEAQRRARTTLTRNRVRRELAHGDIVAQLSFGSWRFLLPDGDPGRQLLWKAALVHAFPRIERPKEDLVRDVDVIHRLRNRVAHLEPLVQRHHVAGRLDAMRRVLRDIEPLTEAWLVSHQRVTEALSRRPVP